MDKFDDDEGLTVRILQRNLPKYAQIASKTVVLGDTPIAILRNYISTDNIVGSLHHEGESR
jgi:hypothetical protein